MSNTNRQLNGTLYAALGVEASADQLRQELQIPEQAAVKDVRDDPAIQEKISANPKHYKTAFAPFRSVVVVFEK